MGPKSLGSVQSILTEDLGIKLVSVKFVPKVLTVKRTETCVAVARDLLPCADQYTNFMKTIIFEYNPETKAQLSQQKSGVSKTKNGTSNSEQGENDVDSFLQP
jgi:hypothetical protein